MADQSGDHRRNPADIRFLGGYVDMKNPTLSDTVAEPFGVSRGIMVLDAATTISFVTMEGTTVALIAADLNKGVVYQFRVLRVNTTGTAMANTRIWLLY